MPKGEFWCIYSCSNLLRRYEYPLLDWECSENEVLILVLPSVGFGFIWIPMSFRYCWGGGCTWTHFQPEVHCIPTALTWYLNPPVPSCSLLQAWRWHSDAPTGCAMSPWDFATILTCSKVRSRKWPHIRSGPHPANVLVIDWAQGKPALWHHCSIMSAITPTILVEASQHPGFVTQEAQG